MTHDPSHPLILSGDRFDLSAQGQCDCDCDCACPQPLETMTDTPLNPWTIGAPSFQADTRLMLPPDLYVAPLQDDYWLAFNPLVDGDVTLLNDVARRILQLFHAGSVVKEAIARAADLNLDEPALESAVAQLVRRSLLVSPDWQAHLPADTANGLVAWLHVTNECNLRCTYCYLHKTPDEMTASIGRQAVDAIFRSAIAHGYQNVKLKFAGGEASLNFARVIEMVDYAQTLADRQQLQLESVVLSNGVGLTQAMAEALRQRRMRLAISLDGIGEVHDAQRRFANGAGSFTAVSHSIERLRAYGLTPEISITITERSVKGLPDLLRYVLERQLPFSLNFYRENDCALDVDALRFSEKHLIAGLQAAYQVIEEYLPEHSLLGAIGDRARFTHAHHKTCAAGDSYVVIDQWGRVAKCQMAITQPIGTIAADDIITLVRDDQSLFRNRPVEEKEGCRDCTWRYWCTGGCPLYTQRLTGRDDVKSPNCRVYQAIYPMILRLEGLRLLRQARRADVISS